MEELTNLIALVGWVFLACVIYDRIKNKNLKNYWEKKPEGKKR